jgi:hypothetical protein
MRVRQLLIALALFTLTPILCVTGDQKRATANPPVGHSNEAEPKSDLKLEVFTDRNTIRKGEQLTLTVWLQSSLTDAVEVRIFFSAPQLNLKGSSLQKVSLPQSQPTTFNFTGAKPGKSNVFVQVSGIRRENGEPLLASQHINGIEVQAQPFSAGGILSNSLFGALLGALFGAFLTVGTTYWAELRQKRKEALQRRRWLTASLPAEIETDRLAVERSQKVNVEGWTSKVAIEGYYSDLQELTRKRPPLGNLVNDLIEISWLMRLYEQERLQDRLTDDSRDALIAKLDSVVSALRQI